MKTAILWDEVEENAFFIVEGEHSDLDGIYLGSCQDRDLLSRLGEIIYSNDPSGIFRQTPMILDEWIDAIRADPDMPVITCGEYL